MKDQESSPDASVVEAIQSHFHTLIERRSAEFAVQPNAPLPQLAELTSPAGQDTWFPVDGMYGGFNYRLEDDGREVRLVVESWSRVCDGSGQRHVITASGSVLVDEGFV